MGDTRFEQGVPMDQTRVASKIKKTFLKKYFTVCFASIGKKEFEIIREIVIDLSQRFEDIFFIIVPRHPNDFGKYKILFNEGSIKVRTRSELLDKNVDFGSMRFDIFEGLHNFGLLWGDSLGELNFYMAMSDIIFMGDSLNNEGSHNSATRCPHGAQYRDVRCFLSDSHNERGDDVHSAYHDDHHEHKPCEEFLHRQGVEEPRLRLLPGLDYQFTITLNWRKLCNLAGYIHRLEKVNEGQLKLGLAAVTAEAQCRRTVNEDCLSATVSAEISEP